jgi:DNA-binding FadR family transcriptional regulator
VETNQKIDQMSLLESERVLKELRRMLEAGDYPMNSRLPPERELCEKFGVKRAVLRKALAKLEGDGHIWRHVGKGTFVGSPPSGLLADMSSLASRTNPAQVMQARLAVEPELARLAALNATAADIAEMRRCLRGTRQAREWRTYELWDNRLHREIARASSNVCLLAVFDLLNAVRRDVAWKRLRKTELNHDHHSFCEHDTLVDLIEERDTEAAAALMRDHLRSVRRDLLASMPD